MRNLKKFLALVLAFMMAFSLMVTAQADYVDDYVDRSEVSERYGEAVDFLNGLGVFKGVENEDGDMEFRPARPITRAEVTALVYRVMTGDVDDKQVSIYENYPSEFSDVAGSANDWAAGYINYCANGLYVHGYGNNIFRPDRNITGYQLLAIVLRCLGYGENGEFEGTGWETRTATTAQRLGITANVAEPLSAEATREEVAEILYRAIQTATVSYGYTYDKNELVADNYQNRQDYDTWLSNGGELPIYETLLYRNFKIVSSADNDVVAYDDFGRPSKTWYVDKSTNTVKAGTKYVYDSTDTDEAFTLKYKAVATYDNVITECDLAKEVNSDKSFEASVWLNGFEIVAKYKVDAVHTVDKYVNAPGRILEIYHTDDGWRLVMIDTFLGVVTDVTPHTEDTAGHLMQPSKLTVGIGWFDDAKNTGTSADYMIEVVATNGDKDYTYSVGDLVLVQTANGKTETLPATDYASVPCTPDAFDGDDHTSARNGNDPILASDVKIKTVSGVTVTGTKGDATSKTGIETDQGVFWLSNVYMRDAESDGDSSYYHTTPDEYYQEVTNSMINKTYDLVLATINDVDYVVGVKESSKTAGVGVVNGVEGLRAGAGKYVASVELTDFDGSVKTIEFLDNSGAAPAYYANADAAEADVNLQENILVAYEIVTKDGKQYAKVVAVGTAEDVAATDSIDGDPIKIAYGAGDGSSDAGQISTILTGVTDTLAGDDTALINDDTRFLIANYGPDYSAGVGNAGVMQPLGYKPYTGFKSIPTIYALYDADEHDTGDGETWDDNYMSDVLYTVLDYQNVRYVAVYAENEEVGYSILGQKTFTIDDSYLAVATGTTYQYFSTYTVLKNGVSSTVNVANTNGNMNEKLEKFIAKNKAAIDNTDGVQLITFTALNASGYYSDVARSEDYGHFNTALDVTGIVADGTYPSYKSGVLTVASGTYLTMATGAQVVIVNAAQGQTYPGTLNSIKQYASNADELTTGDKNAFVWELDSNGYISCLYIID